MTPTYSILERWLKKSRRVFSSRSNDGTKQWCKAVDLARDVYRTLDKKGFNKQ